MKRQIILVVALAALFACRAFASDLAGDELAWVRQRVQELQPKAEDRHLDRIGWASGLLDALRLAREHKRPVFLFTHDGRMAIGRC